MEKMTLRVRGWRASATNGLCVVASIGDDGTVSEVGLGTIRGKLA
jgi:hypothetical protein